MKRMILTVVACLAALSAWAKDVDWKRDYDDALKLAKSEKKMVMIDVYTDWCGWCKKLDKDVYSDKKVQEKLAKSFISVKINPEKNSANKKVAQQFGVRGFPNIIFVDGDGKKVNGIGGYVPADDFLKVLDQVAESKPDSKPASK